MNEEINDNKTLEKNKIIDILKKYIQSGNINFLIGSGASTQAIKFQGDGGNIENVLQGLLEKDGLDEYNKKLCEFLSTIQNVSNHLLSLSNAIELETNQDIEENLLCYQDFLKNLEYLLIKRENNILSKKINIFTTNYDLFLEKASESINNVEFNDGFTRNCSLSSSFEFSTHNFFKKTSNSGKFYNYNIEIPAINIIKLHGSLSWKEENGKIVFTNKQEICKDKSINEEIKTYNDQFALIVPTKNKFKKTLLDHTYYDLLRIYSNELDKENSVLFAFGFSFDDEHIREVTKRALKNSTMQLIIFAYSENSVKKYKEHFEGFQNVMVISPKDIGGKSIDFKVLNEFFTEILKIGAEPDMKQNNKV